MALKEDNFSNDILKGRYKRINKYDRFEIKKDLKRTRNKEDIVEAIKKATKEIVPEAVAAVTGIVVTGIVAIPEIRKIIEFIENKQFITNGSIITCLFIIIISKFVINRTSELIGLARFKILATEYLEEEEPKYAPDLYKGAKIRAR